jgi:hypothetical protein
MRTFRNLFAVLLIVTAAIAHAEQLVTVYKTENCGCCNDWVEHLRINGFPVTAFNVTNLSQVRRELGVPMHLASCHTAKVGGYVIEGHVPAVDIKRLLRERPRIDGLVVPRMPMGSPGMEGPRADDYDVLVLHKGEAKEAYSSYRK